MSEVSGAHTVGMEGGVSEAHTAGMKGGVSEASRAQPMKSSHFSHRAALALVVLELMSLQQLF